MSVSAEQRSADLLINWGAGKTFDITVTPKTDDAAFDLIGSLYNHSNPEFLKGIEVQSIHLWSQQSFNKPQYVLMRHLCNEIKSGDYQAVDQLIGIIDMLSRGIDRDIYHKTMEKFSEELRSATIPLPKVGGLYVPS